MCICVLAYDFTYYFELKVFCKMEVFQKTGECVSLINFYVFTHLWHQMPQSLMHRCSQLLIDLKTDVMESISVVAA